MSHYKDEHGGVIRYFLPQCMGGAVHGIHACTCSAEDSWDRFENAEYKKHSQEMRKEIKDSQTEIVSLNRIIAHLVKSNPTQRKLNKLSAKINRLQTDLEICADNQYLKMFKKPVSKPLTIDGISLHIIEVDAGAQRFVFTDTTATYIFFDGQIRSFEQRTIAYPPAPQGTRWNIESTLESLNQWHAFELLGRPAGMTAREALGRFMDELGAIGANRDWNYLILSLKPL